MVLGAAVGGVDARGNIGGLAKDRATARDERAALGGGMAALGEFADM
jgi:hypothetical protein